MLAFHFWGSLVAIQGIKKQQQKCQDQTEQEVFLLASASVPLSAPWSIQRKTAAIFIYLFLCTIQGRNT